MDANKRRKEIEKVLEGSTGPISATFLAEKLNVSRQVIVGDVALLRAKGVSITATPRGYILDDHRTSYDYVGVLVCNHGYDQIKDELYTIVDFGGVVIDVTVDHHIYGQISGLLNLTSRYDVDQFVNQVLQTGSRPLSDLTGGTHMHKIGCNSKNNFDIIRNELKKMNICF